MAWMELLDVNQRGFDNFVNMLMQIEAQKAAQYNAGLQSKVEQLMNMKEFDPSAKQGPIDAFLYDKFGIETKDTKGVKINEALDKIDLHRYGTDYSDIYDFSQPKRGNVARALFGEYDPNHKSEAFSDRVVSNIQGAGNKNERSMSSFEPMGKNVSDAITANKAKMEENRAKMKANMPNTDTVNAERKTTQKGGKNKAGYNGNNATAKENFIKALQANADMFDTEWLKNIQAQNRMNMSGGK